MAFIRQGGWCSKCGRSWNAAGLGKLEVGISAYECAADGAGRWRAIGPAWQKNGHRLVGSGRPWFLVDGTRSGTGGDGEPLVEQVVFISALERDGATDLFQEVAGSAPPSEPHPKVDAAGNCRDWNSIEIANGDHEADLDDEFDEDSDEVDDDPEPT